MKHTQGIWTYDSNHGCKSIKSGKVVIADTVGIFPEEEDRANAVLIAYAPDLLKALSELLVHALENDLHSEFTENAKNVINKIL